MSYGKAWRAKWTLAIAIVLSMIVTNEGRADFVFGTPMPLAPPINLGPAFASFEGEWYPCISADGLELYVTSDRPGGSGGADLWVATRQSQDDLWGIPVNLGTHVNTSAWDGGPSLSADGLTLYFYSWRSGSSGEANIWMTTRESKEAPWNRPTPLGSTINTSYNERDPSISSDGLTLYYSTDRSGTFDIWQATRNSLDDPWRGPGEPISIVNSPLTDRYPGISPDGLSLLFCSDREGGYDSLDIYVATRTSLNSPWGEPMSMGETINTRLDEASPCITSDGLSLYFSDYSDVYVARRTDLSAAFGTPVSISSHEGSAQLSPDGLTLYFVSERPGTFGRNDIWVAYRNSVDAAWNDPLNLGPAVNSSDLDWAPSVSLDGLELYFSSYNEGRLTDCNIWVCTRSTTDEPWEAAIPLGPQINSDAREYHPTISHDKLMLIFASDRSGGYGNADLYVVRRPSVSEPWGAAENLGPNVNSEYYDYWPSVSPNGRWLFYGSNRPETPTYKDILLSRLQPDGSWGPARNLALEIELPETAGAPTVAGDGSALYFWSFSQGGPGGGDIWKVDLLSLADLNGDGWVEDGDLCAIIDHWGQDEPACDIGPSAMGDGVVDVEDLLTVFDHLGEQVEDPTLIGHWALDEITGSVAVDSTGQNDAMVMGTPLWQPDAGMIDGAIKCDGVNDWIEIPVVVNPGNGPFSVFAWVKCGAPGQVIISQNEGMNWLTSDPVRGALMSELRGTGRSSKPLNADVLITDGDWHRVGFVWDGSNKNLYVDDQIVAETSDKDLASCDGCLHIGCDRDMTPGTFFAGLIDDIRIYRRAVKP